MLSTDQPQHESSYRADKELRQRFGPTVTIVYEIVRHLTGEDGVGPTHAIVATEAGIPYIAARRAIDKLRDAGYLKSEPRFENNRQVSNRYQFPTAIGFLTPAHSEQAICITSPEETQEVVIPEGAGRCQGRFELFRPRCGQR